MSNENNVEDVEKAISCILKFCKEDVKREGLLNTPKRYVKFLDEFLNPRPFEMTCFDSENYNEMITQTGIPFYSLCEHHMAPFFGNVTISYIPKGKIVGLSKLSRTVDKFARRFQNQERMTQQIADFIQGELSPNGVAVTVKARHLCMEMRGIEKHNVLNVTSCLKGLFMSDDKTRSEYFNQLS